MYVCETCHLVHDSEDSSSIALLVGICRVRELEFIDPGANDIRNLHLCTVKLVGGKNWLKKKLHTRV